MKNFDNMINNILGKKKKTSSDKRKTNSFSNMKFSGLMDNKIKFGFRQNRGQYGLNMLKMSAGKTGAPLSNQLKWNTFSSFKKNIMRKNMIDSDKDGVPNKFDCQPFNPKMQDDGKIEKYNIWLKAANKVTQQLKGYGYIIKSVQIRNIGGPDDGMQEFLENLNEFANRDSNIPIDIYVDIPKTTKLGKLLLKHDINPAKFWARVDIENVRNINNLIGIIEILPIGNLSYGIDYIGYFLTETATPQNYDDLPISILNSNKMHLYDMDGAFD